jgi:carbonic anhydrase
VELVFNEGPNDLFVVRVAGNVLGNEIAGSLRYAVDHLADSLRLIAVVGHSGCGAVKAAVEVFLDPAGYLGLASQPMLRGLLDRLLLNVHTSARIMAQVEGPEVVHRPGYRAALVEVSALANVALTAHTIQQQLRAGGSDVRAAYGIYDIATRQVWAPRVDGDEVAGLADPPLDRDGFRALGAAVLRTERIRSILG